MRRPTTWICCFALATVAIGRANADRPNILLITADDMNCDSVGVYGCKVKDTTPNIDRLAAEGMRFDRAHVTIAVCQPCRNVWMTGRYPHRSGGEGFHTLRKPGVPILPAILRENGYRVGLLGKEPHCTPYPDFRWDTPVKCPLGSGRNPRLYAEHAQAFIQQAKQAGKPFFLMANSHDPHRPFYGNDRFAYDKEDGPQVPSKVFRPAEVIVPRFLADIPQVRLEISEYYSSVRRCDDTVGAVLAALDATGLADETIVMFVSDHGMPLPFAKTNVYYHSTRTPWIVRWPGKTQPGSTDDEHFISGVDLSPTLLDVVGLQGPDGADGFSFKPLLTGGRQEGREMVFTQFHQTAGRNRYPMRAVEDKRYRYIYNPWSDGKRVFRNESQSGRTMRAMLAAGQEDPAIAARCDLFLHRVPEELYDLQNDPDALNNLIGAFEHRADLTRLRTALADWMQRTEDPALSAFRDRDNEQARQQFMADQDAQTGLNRRAPTRPKKTNPARPRKQKTEATGR
jgi:N-sulfoglucosamine sulfohydrolase